ncbi:MAG: hypothetical protein C0173_06735 [Desulfurella sp.]|nr:MAG: hypothetical protein C0173_06735 [Desulfurella sp.]
MFLVNVIYWVFYITLIQKRSLKLSKAYLIDSSSNLIEDLSNLILNEDLKQITVIFPNRRPTIYLSKSLASKKKNALSFIELFSIDDFVDRIYELHSDIVYPEISTLEAVFLLYELNQKASFVNTKSIDYFWTWGYKLYSDFEELYLEQVDISSIDYLLQSYLPDNLINFNDRFTRFSYIYKTFYEKLNENGFCTRSVKYKKASLFSKDYKQENTESIIFAGFYDLTKTEQELFKNMLESFNGIFISKYGPKIKDLLIKLNIKNIEEKASYNKKTRYHFIKAPYLHNEIFKLKELKEELNGFRDDDLIVLSSENYLFALLHNCLDPKSDVFNISIGYPLSRTPIISLLDKLLNLHKKATSSIYISDYVNVISHPYIKSLRLGSTDIAAKIYAYSIKSFFLNNARSFVERKDLEDKQLILDSIDKLKQQGFEISYSEFLDFVKLINLYIVDNFLNIKNIGDFLDKVVDLIDFLQNNSNAGLHAIESKYIERTLEILDELSNLNIKKYKLDSSSSYFNLLKNFIKTKNVSFPSSPTQGFQILGSLETRNLTFNRVFYLGANEGIMPNIPKQDTILTDNIRKFLGLPTSKDRLDMQKYNFFNLIYSANEVYFFYETAQDKNKSRFLESIFWDIQKQEKRLDLPQEEDALMEVTFAQGKPLIIENSQKVSQILNGDNFYFSASAIDTFLSCKAKFYFSHILKLKETSYEENLDPMSIGTISHKVLYEYFKDYKGKEYNPGNLHSEFKKIDAIIDNHIQSPSKYVFLQKEQIKYAIRRFFERNFDSIKQRIVLQLEFPLHMKLNINNINYRITGILDKIDSINGTVVVVDYKTGMPKEPNVDFVPTKENRDQWFSKIKSFQLPLYGLLIKKNFTVENIRFEFWSLKESKIISFEITNKQLEVYEEALKIIIDEILFCKYFDCTDENIESKCSNCPYKVICSRQFVTRSW